MSLSRLEREVLEAARAWADIALGFEDGDVLLARARLSIAAKELRRSERQSPPRASRATLATASRVRMLGTGPKR